MNDFAVLSLLQYDILQLRKYKELAGNDRALGTKKVSNCVMNTTPIAGNLECKKGRIRWTQTSQQRI